MLSWVWDCLLLNNISVVVFIFQTATWFGHSTIFSWKYTIWQLIRLTRDPLFLEHLFFLLTIPVVKFLVIVGIGWICWWLTVSSESREQILHFLLAQFDRAPNVIHHFLPCVILFQPITMVRILWVPQNGLSLIIPYQLLTFFLDHYESVFFKSEGPQTKVDSKLNEVRRKVNTVGVKGRVERSARGDDTEWWSGKRSVHNVHICITYIVFLHPVTFVLHLILVLFVHQYTIHFLFFIIRRYVSASYGHLQVL
jgi:hypothetical protein